MLLHNCFDHIRLFICPVTSFRQSCSVRAVGSCGAQRCRLHPGAGVPARLRPYESKAGAALSLCPDVLGTGRVVSSAAAMMAAYPGSGSGSSAGRRPVLGSPAPLERSASSTGVSRRPETVSQSEFLRSHALPALVRMTTGERSADLRSQVDLSRPVLLYRVYQSVKIHARSLMRTDDGGLEEVGPAVVIPEGYRGEFECTAGRCRASGAV